MKLVDKLEDQLVEEKTRLMSMLDYVNRSDLETDNLASLGSPTRSSAPSLTSGSPDHQLRRPSQTYASLIREVRRDSDVDNI